MDLGCLAPNGSRTGFLGNSLPPPYQYYFTLDFDINPHYQYHTFNSQPKVSMFTIWVCVPYGYEY